MKLRREQTDAVTKCRKLLKQKRPARLLIASATGTGKSYVELDLLAREPGGVLLTPSNEIITSLLQKLGHETPSSTARLKTLAADNSIYTPMSFRNSLLRGEMEPPRYLLWDEVHHQTAATWTDVTTLTEVHEIGLTATPYRGTARGTIEFRETWGEPDWIYTYPDAIERGYISLPTFKTVPLLDDDIIEVQAGEFHVSNVESETRSRLMELATLIKSYPLDRPTMVAMPTRALCAELAAMLPGSSIVTGDTKRKDRDAAYEACLACKSILIQIAVVGEGIDLAIRRIFDACPTLSPVRWVQLIGRLMRPGGESEYIGTNRNLLRHVYALQCVIPTDAVADAQEFFGLGTRSAGRAFGLEGLGRFKANPLPLANGLQGEVYLLEQSNAGEVTQYACICHPVHESPLWAVRINAAGVYGRWAVTESPEGFKGFTSADGREPSDKQKAWWTKAARRYGLDPEAKLNRRSFAALPILADLGVILEN